MYSPTVAGIKEHIYRLRAGQQPEVWILCVQDPTVVLECLRREFNTTRDIAIFSCAVELPSLWPSKESALMFLLYLPSSRQVLQTSSLLRHTSLNGRIRLASSCRLCGRIWSGRSEGSSGGWLCISSERQSLRLPCLIWLRVLLLTMSL